MDDVSICPASLMEDTPGTLAGIALGPLVITVLKMFHNAVLAVGASLSVLMPAGNICGVVLP